MRGGCTRRVGQVLCSQSDLGGDEIVGKLIGSLGADDHAGDLLKAPNTHVSENDLTALIDEAVQWARNH